MSSAGIPRGRSAVGRADLLRALAVAPRDALALDIDDSGWFGYVRQEAPAPRQRGIELTGPPQLIPGAMPTPKRRPPLRMPHVYAAIRQVRLPPPRP